MGSDRRFTRGRHLSRISARPARRARKLDLANRNGKPSPPAPRPGPASRFWLSSQALLPHLRSTSLLNCDCGAAGIRRRRQAPVLQPPLPDNSRAYVSRPSLSYSAAAAQPSSSAASAAQRTPSCPSVASRLSPQPQTKPPRASPDPLRLRHRPRRWSLECPPVTPAHGASPSGCQPLPCPHSHYARISGTISGCRARPRRAHSLGIALLLVAQGRPSVRARVMGRPHTPSRHRPQCERPAVVSAAGVG